MALNAARVKKPGVPKRMLLFIAAAVWTAAAVILFIRAHSLLQNSGIPWRFIILPALLGGLLFYVLLFARLSLKHSLRILRMEVEKPCAFAFFSVRSYILMLVMIGAGMLLRRSDSVDPAVIGLFFGIMGFPLLLSSWRFWYYGVRYRRFLAQFSQAETAPPPIIPLWQRRARWWLSVITALMVVFVAFTNWSVTRVAAPYLYDSVDEVPYNRVAVVPGTSSRMASGHSNLFFLYRLQAVAELYKAGKIDFVILSGDNGHSSYNEPRDMTESLVALGVSEEVIYPDYAGFRTFDSVIRAWKVFGQSHFTFVSQKFQNERAIFIARKYGIEVVGFNAREVAKYSGFKTKLREVLARVSAFLDVYLLDRQPRFLGDPIVVGDTISSRDSITQP